MRITGVGAPAAAATPPSLSDITAGTLQVPLKMVATNTVDATALEWVGTSRGMEANLVAGKAYYLNTGGTSAFLFKDFGSYLGADNLFIGTGTTVGNDGLSLTMVAAGDSDATRGAAITFYGLNHPDAAHRGSCFLSTPTGKGYFFNCDASSGAVYTVQIDSTGLMVGKSGGSALFSPGSLTGSRTYTLPDATGTLMLSGGSGSVPLSNLTAGTIIPGLVLDWGPANGTAIGTSGSTQIYNSSTGLVFSCKTTSKTIKIQSDTSTTFTFANTTHTSALGLTFSAARAAANNQVGLGSDNYMFLNGTTGSGLMVGGAYGIYTDGVQTYLGLPLNLYSAVADLASTFVYTNSSDGVSCTRNVVSGGSHNHKVAGTTKFAVNGSNCVFADPPKYSTALGAVTGGSGIPTLPALGTGGTGQPATAGQNGWLKAVDSGGATIYIPVWK